MNAPDFDAISLDDLRHRRSAKWRTHDPDVLPAWIAEADVPLAEPVRAALADAVERSDTGYAHAGDLQDAVAAWLGERHGWAVDPTDVHPVADVMVGVAELLTVATEPGDGVVINPPVYPPFAKTVRHLRRQIVDVPLRTDADGWALDLDGLEAAFRGGARAYVLCSPHNPVGAVWPAAALTQVAELAERYGAAVISDEVHGPLTLPDATFVPYATVSETAAGNGVTLLSASKAWNLAGLKCAAILTCSERTRALAARLDPHLGWGVGHLGALAMTASLRAGRPWLEAFVGHLDRNRVLLGDLLAERLPDVGYRAPQATFLTWLDCTALGLGDDPAEAFRTLGRVALSRGLDFGAPGAGFVRLNIGTSRSVLTEAVDRMAATVRH